MSKQRLLSAPDLVTRQEYGKVEGRKVLLAIVRSSKVLGLEDREEIRQPTAVQAKGQETRRKDGNARS